MRTTTATAAVLALTAAGVVLTSGVAHADPTPSPTIEAWTVDELTPVAPSPTGRNWSVDNIQPAAPASAPAAAPSIPTVEAPTSTPNRVTSVRHRPVSRTGARVAAGCQPLRDGAWLVRPGDTLWWISVCTRRDLPGLVTVNDLPDGGRLIFPGDRIAVRPPVR